MVMAHPGGDAVLQFFEHDRGDAGHIEPAGFGDRQPDEFDEFRVGSDKAIGAMRDGEKVQFEVYEIGKRHQFEPLRDWFKGIYEVLFGQSQGPRFGSFAVLFGCNETAAMIEKALNAPSV